MKTQTRKFQKALALILVLVMALATLTAFPAGAALNAGGAVKGQVNGDGTPEGQAMKFSIGNAHDLATLMLPAGETIYVELTADIDMSGVAFTPLNSKLAAVDDYASSMKNVVVFEGNGHTIRNLSVTTTWAPAGLFAKLYQGSVVRNLKFENADIVSQGGLTNAAGVVAGNAGSSITLYNVSTDKNSSVHAGGTGNGMAGGLIGMIIDQSGREANPTGTNFSYCVNAASVQGGIRVGGILGSYHSMDPITVRYCINNGPVTNNANVATNISGILGSTLAENGTRGVAHVFEDCVNAGTLTANTTGTDTTSGILGNYSRSTTGRQNGSVTLTRCYDHASVRSASGGTVKHGAFLGNATPNTTFTDCYATGTGYTTAIAGNDTKPTGVTIDTAQAATVTTKVNALMNTIATAATQKNNVKLDISAAGGNLSLRLSLNKPYGFMAISTVKAPNGTVVAFNALKDYKVNSCGFVFLRSDKTPNEAQMIAASTRVEGVKYEKDATGKKFAATYSGMGAYELGQSVYMAAYVEIMGCIFISDIRELTPVDQFRTLATGNQITDAKEKAIYAATVKYHDSYANYYQLLHKMDPLSVKVATYNIYHAADVTRFPVYDGLNDGSEAANNSKAAFDAYWSRSGEIVDVSKAASVIFHHGIEICGLEETSAYAECYNNNGKTQAQQIAEELSRLTGETWYWGFVAGRAGGSYAAKYTLTKNANGTYSCGVSGTDADGTFGNSIVSKHPITAIQGYALKNGTGRCVLRATINVGGTTLTTLVTHLESTSKTDRENSVAELAAIAKTITGPAMLMGDFNINPTEEIYADLTAIYPAAAPADQLPKTFSSTNPNRTIDNIFPSKELKAYDIYTDVTALYSDHLPFIMTVDIPKK